MIPSKLLFFLIDKNKTRIIKPTIFSFPNQRYKLVPFHKEKTNNKKKIFKINELYSKKLLDSEPFNKYMGIINSMYSWNKLLSKIGIFRIKYWAKTRVLIPIKNVNSRSDTLGINFLLIYPNNNIEYVVALISETPTSGSTVKQPDTNNNPTKSFLNEMHEQCNLFLMCINFFI